MKVTDYLCLRIAVIIIFISSTIYMTDLRSLQRPLLVLGLLLILIASLLVKRNWKLNFSMVSVFYFLIFSCMIAVLKNADVELGIGAVLLGALFLILSIILPSLYNKSDYVAFIAKCMLIAHIPFILVSLFVDNFTIAPFAGVFYTGNALGSITATVYCVLLANFAYRFEKMFFNRIGKYIHLFLLLLFLSILFYLTILSGSRNCTITIISLTFIMFFLVFLKIGYYKKLKFVHFLKFTAYIIFAVPLFFLINLFIPIIDMFNQVIVGKFILKQNDVLDLRGIVWQQTFEKAGLFGGGRDFFVTETVAAALNTFISILGQYGWIALILFTIYTLMSIHYAFRYMLTNHDDKYGYLPIFMVILFVLLSTAESMMLKSSMLAVMALTGYTQFKTLRATKNNDYSVARKVICER